MFKLAIFQVVSPFFWGGGRIQELLPEFGFVNLDPAGSVLAFSILDLLRCSGLVMLHIHRNDTVGQFNPEAVLKRWDSSGNRKFILQSPTVIWNCSLNYYFKYQSVILCLIYHRSFGGVVAIYNSNWYIKRPNNIEIDKNKMLYFGPLSPNFRSKGRGCFARTDPPYIGASIGDPHTTASPVLNP